MSLRHPPRSASGNRKCDALHLHLLWSCQQIRWTSVEVDDTQSLSLGFIQMKKCIAIVQSSKQKKASHFVLTTARTTRRPALPFLTVAVLPHLPLIAIKGAVQHERTPRTNLPTLEQQHHRYNA